MSVRIVDNTQKFINELNVRKKIVHTAWGEIAEGYAKEEALVDTGAMRNAVNYEASENKMIIGDTQDYSIFVEQRHPFIRPAIENHLKEYELIAEDILKR